MQKTARYRTFFLLSFVAVLALAVFPGFSARAHDVLVGSSPASGDVVTAELSTVSLTFNENLLVLGEQNNGFAVNIVDSVGGYYHSGCLSVAAATITTAVALGEAGSYQVQWQVVSSDGHPISGSYSFSWQPPAGYQPKQSVADPPTCGSPWAGEPVSSHTPKEQNPVEISEPTQSAAPVSGRVSEGFPWTFVAILGATSIFLLVAIAVSVVFVRKKKVNTQPHR